MCQCLFFEFAGLHINAVFLIVGQNLLFGGNFTQILNVSECFFMLVCVDAVFGFAGRDVTFWSYQIVIC